jgi:SAM-dependent methyltransferase
MSQVTSGLRRVLAHPAVYDFFQNLVGASACRIRWTHDFLKPFSGARILDIGCGTAQLLRHLPADIDYTGFDMSEEYIEAARKRYGDRGRFSCDRVLATAEGDSETGDDSGSYDIAVAFGVLHHLDDEEGRQVFRSARRALKPSGRFVTLDPAFIPDQGRLSRYVVSHDRGQNVRFPEAYAALGKGFFSDIKINVVRKALRIPTDQTILVCQA